MILNLGSLSFNANLKVGGGTPAWGTELGQGEGYKFSFEDMSDFFTGMVYCSVSNIEDVTCPLGKGGKQQNDYDFVIASLFDKVYVNRKRITRAKFVLLVVKKLVGDNHVGRRTLKYNPNMTYQGERINEDCYKKMALTLGLSDDAAWFVHEINILNQNELHFTAYVLNDSPVIYNSTELRRTAYLNALPKNGDKPAYYVLDNELPLQQIFYGAPGTGKSHEVKIITGELDGLGKECQCKNVFRTTFHPDTDYATFVGCYKPTMKTVEEKYRAVAGKEEDIVYEFVPQAFTDAYIYAYKNPAENTFLVIEEINRGNCAQIFGDLFQLLDRNGEGISEYTIKADKDLAKYLTKELGADSDGIKEGKLRLPANLHILATMNTSDQSLFPMDSAFKRRWDWRYVAISYSEPKSSTFKINVGEGYSWVDFIEQVNKRIFDLTQSEDKEMGNFFIKDSIDAEQFKSKVMFYLWFEVLRDEVENSKYFFYYTTQDESGKETNHKFTFKDLYGENAEIILEGFLKYITKGAE